MVLKQLVARTSLLVALAGLLLASFFLLTGIPGTKVLRLYRIVGIQPSICYTDCETTLAIASKPVKQVCLKLKFKLEYYEVPDTGGKPENGSLQPGINGSRETISELTFSSADSSGSSTDITKQLTNTQSCVACGCPLSSYPTVKDLVAAYNEQPSKVNLWAGEGISFFMPASVLEQKPKLQARLTLSDGRVISVTAPAKPL